MTAKTLTVWIAISNSNKSKTSMFYAVPFLLGGEDKPAYGYYSYREKDCQSFIDRNRITDCHPAKFVIAV